MDLTTDSNLLDSKFVCSAPHYVIPASSCTQERGPLGGRTTWTAALPPGVTAVVTPHGMRVNVSPGCHVLKWTVADEQYTTYCGSDVKTHAKVNGGKLMFEVRNRVTIDGTVFYVLFNGTEVYVSPDTYDSGADAEKAGAKFVAKAVAKLLAA